MPTVKTLNKSRDSLTDFDFIVIGNNENNNKVARFVAACFAEKRSGIVAKS
jgi:hypothetical protein